MLNMKNATIYPQELNFLDISDSKKYSFLKELNDDNIKKLLGDKRN